MFVYFIEIYHTLLGGFVVFFIGLVVPDDEEIPLIGVLLGFLCSYPLGCYILKAF